MDVCNVSIGISASGELKPKIHRSDLLGLNRWHLKVARMLHATLVRVASIDETFVSFDEVHLFLISRGCC